MKVAQQRPQAPQGRSLFPGGYEVEEGEGFPHMIGSNTQILAMISWSLGGWDACTQGNPGGGAAVPG